MEFVKLGTHTLFLSSPSSSSSSLTPFISSRVRSIRGGRRRNSLRLKLLPTHHLILQVPTPNLLNSNINHDDNLPHLDVDVNVEGEGEDKVMDNNKNDYVFDYLILPKIISQSTTSTLFNPPHFLTTTTTSNLSSTLGFGLFSFLFLFSLSKLLFLTFSFTNNEEGDMSPLHREMLRRKIKSRMLNSPQHQDQPPTVSVSVSAELAVVVDDKSTTSTRPPLDHSLLFHTIRHYPHPHPPNTTTTTTTADTNTNTNTTSPLVPPQTQPHSLSNHSHVIKHQSQPAKPNNNIPMTTLRKPKLILSLHQAREYLSHKHQGIPIHDDSNHSSTPSTSAPHFPIHASNSTKGSTTILGDISSNLRNEGMPVNLDRHEQNHATPNDCKANIRGAYYDEQGSFFEDDHDEDNDATYDEQGPTSDNDGGDQTSLDFGNNAVGNMGGSQADSQTWLQTNFDEVEPILNKIGAGFRSNYMMAREKVKHQDISLDFLELESIKDDTELDWMQDDKLREIVFRVRDNELAGRDPFHSIDPEDKLAFFNGLESQVHQENEKLSTLHAWLHSNIENIDYGADGISLYDPPDKVVPRWKGSSIDKIPEFLSKPAEQPKVASSVQKANESELYDKTKLSQANSTPNEVAKISKTIIEASDGSIKPGRKSGKEYWQHTKKWSRGFLESYNAESDPKVKSAMKDIGKGLNRWISEEEIQEAAVLMEKIPKRGKEYIEKKLNKVKREMQQFGAAAVVSKYREYADEKEEDYLWWLDLRYVLCIELYTYVGEDQRVGFYSLEMGLDLELEPKPHHVIAFEDPGDCKNLCYIIQAHLEMLGSGRAFVVAQPPKDVFRHAKSNGFGVTVLRKGELHLNIDQPLEEVEESITEIGSKMYHDKLMRERSVDINSLMKGVFGITKPPKRKRRKRAQTKLHNS